MGHLDIDIYRWVDRSPKYRWVDGSPRYRIIDGWMDHLDVDIDINMCGSLKYIYNIDEWIT